MSGAMRSFSEGNRRGHLIAVMRVGIHGRGRPAPVVEKLVADVVCDVELLRGLDARSLPHDQRPRPQCPCRLRRGKHAQTGTRSRSSSSPAKSSGLRVSRGRPSATAMAAISRSANLLRGWRPAATTAE